MNSREAWLSVVIIAVAAALIPTAAMRAADLEVVRPKSPLKNGPRPQPPLSHVEVTGLAVQFASSAPDSQIIGKIRHMSKATGWEEAALGLAIFRESLAGMNDDKKYYLSKLQAYNDMGEKLAAYLEMIADSASQLCDTMENEGACRGPSNEDCPPRVPLSSSVNKTRSLVAKSLRLLDQLQVETAKVDTASLTSDQKQLMARLERDARRYRHLLQRYDRLSRQLAYRTPARPPASQKAPAAQQKPMVAPEPAPVREPSEALGASLSEITAMAAPAAPQIEKSVPTPQRTAQAKTCADLLSSAQSVLETMRRSCTVSPPSRAAFSDQLQQLESNLLGWNKNHCRDSILTIQRKAAYGMMFTTQLPAIEDGCIGRCWDSLAGLSGAGQTNVLLRQCRQCCYFYPFPAATTCAAECDRLAPSLESIREATTQQTREQARRAWKEAMGILRSATERQSDNMMNMAW